MRHFVRVYSTEDPKWLTVEWDIDDKNDAAACSYGTMSIPSDRGMNEPHLEFLRQQGIDVEDHRKEVYTKDGPQCRS